MEFYSLLNSYGHVVYENKKSFEKKNSEKIFFERWNFENFEISKISKISEKSENATFSKNINSQKKSKKKFGIFLIDRKNIFRHFFFQNFFVFVN